MTCEFFPIPLCESSGSKLPLYLIGRLLRRFAPRNDRMSVCLQPISPHAQIHDHRHFQIHSSFHLFLHRLLDLV